tara:strand:- start:190 stop:306 length:117 start_codon:yes stop_codon:yes gene_type:complete
MIRDVMMIKEKHQRRAVLSHTLPEKTLVTALAIIKVGC